MNSLNIITSRVSPPPSPVASRSNSLGSMGLTVQSDDDEPSGESAEMQGDNREAETFPLENHATDRGDDGHQPAIYVVAYLASAHSCFFAPFTQLKKIFGFHGGSRKLATDFPLSSEKSGRQGSAGYGGVAHSRASSGSSSSGLSSESESDADRQRRGGSAGRHSRSKSSAEEIAPARRSIRIKLHNDELPQRKHRKTQSATARPKSESGSDISAQLKSPTSPAGALTRYPKTPAPPRPLIPRRQPSYLNIEPSNPNHQKTLILDLDETLIHSMSKGGRMSTGHMVEVRLNQTYVGAGGQTSIGPQHPILYWVNKRPYCDDFLRRVCKWYNLVVFTASVQEYADPVIDCRAGSEQGHDLGQQSTELHVSPR
ncbi:Nuclear envelope morphology protein 1 [Colletotrichum orbiculare MAFF 240422]|uniref:Mitochondrial import inner membrane translocase subunit TIM50 n=1 Tax=Colletotrichum orbiculare (strain 104-T / ATCC 96160 / CBS 514.97 / LARS 414 / MAFF 240422) TaxID=1213857 RepID=A0A484F822_COLOR|nr:Nuclear envelope morphology protein 1 [Colletotrichum orbiculare MAFF 240422]